MYLGVYRDIYASNQDMAFVLQYNFQSIRNMSAIVVSHACNNLDQ